MRGNEREGIMPTKKVKDILATASPALKKVLRPSVLDIITISLQRHWDFFGIKRETPIFLRHNGKDALVRCVIDAVNLERETSISFSSEEITNIKTIGELEDIIIRKIVKEKRGGTGTDDDPVSQQEI